MLENDGKFSDPLLCVVDSGGDWCLFPLDFLEPLGIDKNGLSIDYPHGLGEGCEAYFATVTLHAMNLGFWETCVGFSANWMARGLEC
jgi:hypothetical protein